MASEDTPVSGVAVRYASALISLAQEQGQLDSVLKDLDRFRQLLDDSKDLSRLVQSPIFSTKEQQAALSIVLARAGMGDLATTFILFVTRQRRLRLIRDISRAFFDIAHASRGIVKAKVLTAHALTEQHGKSLQDALCRVSGASSVQIEMNIDPSLLGGMVVQLGSRRLDASLKTKLHSIHARMKGVG